MIFSSDALSSLPFSASPDAVVVTFVADGGVLVSVYHRGTLTTVGSRGTVLDVPSRGQVVRVANRVGLVEVRRRGTLVRVTQRGDMDIPSYDRFTTDDLPYDFAFDGWPFLISDTIASASVSATPTGLTIGTPAISTDGRQVQVTISGGTAGVEYTVSCVATTTAGRDVTGRLVLVTY